MSRSYCSSHNSRLLSSHFPPDSARLGLERGQIDLGWALIRTLMALGLASEVRLPENLRPRDGLRRLPEAGDYAPRICGHSCSGCHFARNTSAPLRMIRPHGQATGQGLLPDRAE